MPQSERKKSYDKQIWTYISGFRLLCLWNYIDPGTMEPVTLPENLFVTQPYTNGKHRSGKYPKMELLIPRSLLRRARATCKVIDKDKVLLGELEPKTHRDFRWEDEQK